MLNDATSQILQAYQVDESYEGHSVVIFARSNVAARRMGASQLDVGFEEVACRRAKQFDEYAPGPVPRDALLDDGWWFECAHCMTRVERGGTDEDDQPLDACVAGEDVFCSACCKGAHLARQRGRAAAVSAMVELLTTRYPEADVLDVHVYGDRLEAVGPGEALKSSAKLRFPGLTYPVSYHFGRSAMFVSQVDVEAFRSRYGTA